MPWTTSVQFTVNNSLFFFLSEQNFILKIELSKATEYLMHSHLVRSVNQLHMPSSRLCSPRTTFGTNNCISRVQSGKQSYCGCYGIKPFTNVEEAGNLGSRKGLGWSREEPLNRSRKTDVSSHLWRKPVDWSVGSFGLRIASASLNPVKCLLVSLRPGVTTGH